MLHRPAQGFVCTLAEEVLTTAIIRVKNQARSFSWSLASDLNCLDLQFKFVCLANVLDVSVRSR